ncbi:hypothetical protein M011DRAFT_513281 [Sporormia fimetaria CBS 119925]|uniref:Uncharacterized protein n=1 Tax=Sporormia fimetaria CBS 119925 TaxID=1340428 RepID=A0A6A6VGP2_9PLEO|nr:hypothetical protein M011DRAFT_513281 [Sporormia fimetaria CBS 119925]
MCTMKSCGRRTAATMESRDTLTGGRGCARQSRHTSTTTLKTLRGETCRELVIKIERVHGLGRSHKYLARSCSTPNYTGKVVICALALDHGRACTKGRWGRWQHADWRLVSMLLKYAIARSNSEFLARIGGGYVDNYQVKPEYPDDIESHSPRTQLRYPMNSYIQAKTVAQALQRHNVAVQEFVVAR